MEKEKKNKRMMMVNHETWNFGSQSNYSSASGEDYLSGFTWPPRSYTCSFCKREFKSAQALGGHMNVHRRDRARLRQVSPPSSPPPPPPPLLSRDHHYHHHGITPNPNPNFNSFLTSSSSSSPLITCTLPPLVSPSRNIWNHHHHDETPKLINNNNELGKLKNARPFFDDDDDDDHHQFGGFKNGNGCHKLFKKGSEIVRLDLEIGLFTESKEILDLELRLGY